MGFRSSPVAPIAALTAGGRLFLALSSPACAAIGRVKNRLSERLAPLRNHSLVPIGPSHGILP